MFGRAVFVFLLAVCFSMAVSSWADAAVNGAQTVNGTSRDFGDDYAISDDATSRALFVRNGGDAVFGDNASILHSGSSEAVYVAGNNSKLVFGDNAFIENAGGGIATGVRADNGSNITVEFGDDAYIYSHGGSVYNYGFHSFASSSDFSFGDNVTIIASNDNIAKGIYTVDAAGNYLDQLLIFGKSADIRAEGLDASGIHLGGKDSTLIMGDGARISAISDLDNASGRAYGILALVDGSTVEMGDNSEIIVEGNIGGALIVDGQGSIATVGDGLKVRVSGDSDGIYAQESGTIIVGDNLDVIISNTSGSQASGLAAQATTGKSPHLTVGRNANVEVYGDQWAMGVVSNYGGTVNVSDDLTVIVTGEESTGLSAWGSAGTTTTMTIGENAQITASGTNTKGVDAAGNDTTIHIAKGADVSASGSAAAGVYAESYGRLNIADDAKIAASGSSSVGVYVSYAGRADIADNATISVDGSSAKGISVNRSDSSASFGDSLILTASGDNAQGVYGYWGGQVDIGDSADISVTGSNAMGVYVIHKSADVRIGDDAVIAVKGTNAKGLYANASAGYEGSSIEVGNNADIDVEGSGSIGAYSYYGSRMQIGDSAVINVSGDHSRGVYAYWTSDVTIGKNAEVTTNGDHAYGLYAEYGALSLAAGDNISVVTKGDGSHAVFFDSLGAYQAGSNDIALGNGATLATEGEGAYAVYTKDGKVSIGSGAEVETAGAGAFGLYSENGMITLDGGNVTTRGVNAHAVVVSGDAGYIIALDGAIKATGDGWNLVAETGGMIDLANMTVGDGVNLNLLSTSSSGDVFADDSALTGNVVHTGAFADILTLTLSGDSSLAGTVNAANQGRIDFTLDDSVWNVTGDSHTRGVLNMNDNSVVDYSGAALGIVARVDSLTGSGHFNMKTDIVSQSGDRLVVESSSAGSHTITVANQGSAETTGYERVMLIETADTNSTFSLTSAVDLGAWQYTLRNSSDDRGEFDSSGGQYWELYSAEGSSQPDSSNPGSAAVNTFVASYLLNYAETNTLIQRLGDLRNVPYSNGAWFRAYGGKFKDFERSYVKNFDMDYGGVQVGYDRKVENNWKGDTYVGAFIGFGKADLDYVENGGGSGGAENRTMGMYATYVGNGGFYVDAIAKYTWSELEFDVLDSAGTLVTGDDVNSGGAGLSLETGKRFRFGKESGNGGRWYIEPQLQLSWQHMSGGYFTASNGLRIGLDSYDSLLGRAGVLFGYETNRTNFYAKVSYVKEFDGDMTINANGADIFESMDDHWLVYGLGVTHQMNDRNALYLDFERASEGKFTQDWAIKGGWRIQF